MLSWLKKFLVLSVSTIVVTAVHAQISTTLNPPQPVENDGRIEVLEFFAYGCIHCANLEPTLETWAKRQSGDVKLKRIPSSAPIMGIDSTVLYYSLEGLGQIDRLHAKVFTAVHLERVVLGNPAMLNKWLEKNGVDPVKYEEIQKSFSVVTKVNRARKMLEDYKIRDTPTIVVNGRTAVVQGSSGQDPFFASIDQLVTQARTSLNAASAAKAAPIAPPFKSETKKAANAATK